MAEDPQHGDEHKPHVITYRANHERSDWLRRRAYEHRTTFQAILDEAVDLLRNQPKPASTKRRRTYLSPNPTAEENTTDERTT